MYTIQADLGRDLGRSDALRLEEPELGFTEKAGKTNSVVRNMFLLSEYNNLILLPLFVSFDQFFRESNPDHPQPNNNHFLAFLSRFIANEAWRSHTEYQQST